MINRRNLLVLGTTLPILLPSVCLGQAFPSKPVRIVVPFGAGGIADLTARAIGLKLGDVLQQSVVIENRPGAGGIVAGEAVARAEPDGHTLLLMSNATAVSAGLFKTLPFDAQKDFAPVATLGFFDIAILANGNSRFQTLPELLAYAKANPGKLNLASINIGSTQHLAAELFKTTAGIDVQVVPFNGSPAVLTALRGGQVDVAVEILGPMMGQIASKAVRPLAVMSAKRAASLPEVPTADEAGLRGFNVASWNALAAPARTPPAVIATLNAAVNKVLVDPGLRKQLADINVAPAGGTPEQLRELLGSEIRRWAEVIARAGVPRQ